MTKVERVVYVRPDEGVPGHDHAVPYMVRGGECMMTEDIARNIIAEEAFILVRDEVIKKDPDLLYPAVTKDGVFLRAVWVEDGRKHGRIIMRVRVDGGEAHGKPREEIMCGFTFWEQVVLDINMPAI